MARNFANAPNERNTETFCGPQDPFNLATDYGRADLDVTHSFKAGAVLDLAWGFTRSNNFIAHSGVRYPACSKVHLNGDGLVNPFAQNDRLTVQIGNGMPRLIRIWCVRR